MADDVERNKLAGPPEPSMLEHAQHFARNWWNGLAGMYDQYGPKGSAAMQERGPWMRDVLPKGAANFAELAITHGPMGFRAPANAAMVVPRGMSGPAKPGEFPSQIMDPRVGADSLSRTMNTVYPYSMRNYADPNRSNGMVALPEEVGFWAKQVPANAMRNFTVIPGDKP